MEEINGSSQNNPSAVPVAPICPQCHLPVRPEYYFCPNCGQKLHVPPLSTTVVSQILLYVFSAILPWIAYLAITKWEGIKYIRSGDARARTIGWIALGILVVSSVVAFWLATVWIDQTINSTLTGVNGLTGSGGSLGF
ncbi:MAG: zinc ribbon domain-containing protein [Candidatus Pacebacteria bacterium]|nr:zinc ribbon domain-containing protein [Candidatus Paceibacterota bacterium]